MVLVSSLTVEEAALELVRLGHTSEALDLIEGQTC